MDPTFYRIPSLLLCLNLLFPTSADICYPVVGCFDNNSPWTSLIRLALPPENPGKVATFMYFHDRKTVSNSYANGVNFTIFPNIDLSKVHFGVDKPTFVITHGYTDNGTLPWIINLKDTILNRMDANVFVSDYSNGVSGSYFQAVGNARVMGKLGALVLEKTQINPKNIHLIGHSLGAHVSSYIAKNFLRKGMKVKRITGLDPAAPFFQGENQNVRLDSSDADLVVAIHTNAGGLGVALLSGHVDFFFNGGTDQPGCSPSPIQYLFSHRENWLSCSHQRAHEYFIEAVNNTCSMWGKPATLRSVGTSIINSVTRGLLPDLLTPRQDACEDGQCLPVGLETDQYQRKGVFVVFTRSSPPFCIPILQQPTVTVPSRSVR